MYFANQTMGGLAGFSLKKFVKKISPTHNIVKKITGKSGTSGVKALAKKVGPIDPATRILQKRVGRTPHERGAQWGKLMRSKDKITPESKFGRRAKRLLNPMELISPGLDSIADAGDKLGPERFKNVRKWISPASYLHRKGGPLRRDPVAVPVGTPTGTTEILEVPAVQDSLSRDYETYPVDEKYGETYAYPGIPDNAVFYDADGSGNAAPNSGGAVVNDADAKPKMSGRDLLKLVMGAFALAQFIS